MSESGQGGVRFEEFQVSGDQLVAAVKDLVRQGNIRRITIKNASGTTLVEIPLFVGVAGAVLVPVWAAVGALAALVAKCTLGIERVEPEPGTPPATLPKKRAPRKK